MKRRYCAALLVGVLLGALARADPYADGARVVFFGDSITHAAAHVRVIADYYLTHYPMRKVLFFNAGVAGDNSKDAMSRFEFDVVRRDPTDVVIMFGMNDCGYQNYDPAVRLPYERALALQRSAALDFAANLRAMAERFGRELPKACVTYVTSSPYDENARTQHDRKAPYVGANESLGRLADVTRAHARACKCDLVDFYARMSDIAGCRQMCEPSFSLVNSDRIHPGEVGGMVMACIFLDHQGVPSIVSRTVVNAADLTVEEAVNAMVGEIASEQDGLSFTVEEKSLPFPVSEGALAAFEILPIARRLNREELVVTGLPEGEYGLFVDGLSVGKWSNRMLERGINLGMNRRMPQSRQAEKVRELNWIKMHLESSTLRDYATSRWILRKQGVDPDDFNAVREAYAKAAKPRGYYQSRWPKYIEGWSHWMEVEDRIRKMERELDGLRQPQPHVYRLKRIETGVQDNSGTVLKTDEKKATKYVSVDELEPVCREVSVVENRHPSLIPNGVSMRLVWHDEFDGDALDESKWSYRTNFWGRRAHWFARPEDDCVEVGGGVARLKVRKLANGQYVSPQLQTGELMWDIPRDENASGFWPLPRRNFAKFLKAYGYFECRCKLQQMPGWWSAFWMQAQGQGTTLDPAFSGIEHDIMESFDPGEVVPACFHYNGYGPDYHGFKIPDVRINEDAMLLVDKTQYHTFGMLWDSDGYSIYVDGRFRGRSTKAVSGVPEFILLTTECKWYRQKKMTGSAVPELEAAANTADAFVVDYVRVFDVDR